ncbi:cysteine-rich RLK (RECEPTOR-like protein kinase) 8 [Abeliophyllum distichum]|uniref:Cysteine-rich RLK (RECEPTOR-like protein kinase) 8 n=1 Tax=Abeliophyllum distichum TaxID=126358 RepID=A0ABD1USU8_9LAMI
MGKVVALAAILVPTAFAEAAESLGEVSLPTHSTSILVVPSRSSMQNQNKGYVQDKHVIGSCWVYKIKTKSGGSIEHYKAKLVAKGFTQQYGLDYEEAFASVAKMTIVRTLIAIAYICWWDLSQLDVKNAFLNGTLQENIYMVPPPSVFHHRGYVYKLKKAFYGLKQAPRTWFEKFSTVVASLSFTPKPS